MKFTDEVEVEDWILFLEEILTEKGTGLTEKKVNQCANFCSSAAETKEELDQALENLFIRNGRDSFQR